MAFHNMTQHSQAIHHLVEEPGGTAPLVRMLASTSLPKPVRRSAAAAVFGRDLSSTSTQEADELDMCIRRQELQALVSLLSSSTADCQEEVLLAIWSICQGNADLSGRICQLGGLQAMVDLLKCMSSKRSVGHQHPV